MRILKLFPTFALRGAPPKKPKSYPVIHASQRPPEPAEVDFSCLGLTYPVVESSEFVIKKIGWSPPPVREPDLPFQVCTVLCQCGDLCVTRWLDRSAGSGPVGTSRCTPSTKAGGLKSWRSLRNAEVISWWASAAVCLELVYLLTADARTALEGRNGEGRWEGSCHNAWKACRGWELSYEIEKMADRYWLLTASPFIKCELLYTCTIHLFKKV